MTEEGDGQIDGLRMGREISLGEVKSFASKFKATTAKRKPKPGMGKMDRRNRRGSDRNTHAL